ncbi:MAG TPA: tRNA (adenosine(37)-N6)-threonylcarbamoyltransferase complex ATPase subunit type 1 TsaE [bacterium]|nr:tRNA (adenosine(37)-N6)-threonylcarbamoyltransferase complex ATPase subunit type 1 TsaE [bacterium]
MSKITTQSDQETQKLAERFAAGLKGPAVLGLVGELGSGKTQFTKGLARALKIKNRITSPTFVLLKPYPITHPQKGIKNLIHIDCYRLSHPEELLALGWQELLISKENLIVVEWADKIKNIMPKDTLWIDLKQGRGETERIIQIKSKILMSNKIQNPKLKLSD